MLICDTLIEHFSWLSLVSANLRYDIAVDKLLNLHWPYSAIPWYWRLLRYVDALFCVSGVIIYLMHTSLENSFKFDLYSSRSFSFDLKCAVGVDMLENLMVGLMFDKHLLCL